MDPIEELQEKVEAAQAESQRWYTVAQGILNLEETREDLLARWEAVPTAGSFYLRVRGKDCEITMEPRPPHCDRGRWLAKLHPDDGSELARSLDAADGWPRYYFDRVRGQLEIESWLQKRRQMIYPDSLELKR